MADPVEDIDLHCLECDYNLTGVESARCPECGWAINYAVLQIARDPTVAGAQVSMLAALCGVVGLIPFGLLAVLLWYGRWLTGPPAASLAFALTTTACAILLLVLAFYVIPTARLWPVYAPRFALTCRVAAAAQLVSVIVGVVQANTYGVIGLVLGFLLASGVAWVLLFATFVALSAKGDILQGYLDEQSRRGDEKESDAPFIVHATGRFSPEHVEVVWDDTKRETNPEIETSIEAIWTEKRRQADRSDQILYNGPVGRLVAFEVERTRLVLRIGATDYRDFVGTNISHVDQAQRYDTRLRADPLGTSATVLTSDGHLLYGRRGERVASHAGGLHTFGGMLEKKDQRSDNCYDVFGAVRRELREELHLTEREIVDVVCTGLVRDSHTLQPELLFDAEVSLTRGEILSRFDAATDEEHTAIEGCLDEPEAIVPFVNRSQPVVPVALAAILLHGRANWGLDWYESTAYVLFGDLPRHTTQRGGQ